MTSFSRTNRFTQGYDPEQVEDFFARARQTYEGLAEAATGTHGGGAIASRLTAHEVRIAAFDLVRGGYDVHQVDSALDRLEDALASRERERLVQADGEEALFAELSRRAQALHGRLNRPDGQRFDRCQGFEPGYAPEDVDALCTRLLGYFNDGEEMSADEVRRAVFRTRRGKRGYREMQVDAFLDRVVEIMVAVD
ncbi:MAG TPA: DivIVA domain-containing protein [Actinomycetales bacterium]|nr:DivIVA domain-containing protein [Actinomycetales bacterium]